MALLYPLLASIVSLPIAVDHSDRKGSSDITQSISKRGEEDAGHGGKRIYHTKYSFLFFKQPWPRTQKADQTSPDSRGKLFGTLAQRLEASPPLPPVHHGAQERDRQFSDAPPPPSCRL